MTTKKIILILVVVLIAALVGFGVYRMQVQAPAPQRVETTYTPPTDDSQTAIQKELDTIDTGVDLETDFKTTDEDIQAL